MEKYSQQYKIEEVLEKNLKSHSSSVTFEQIWNNHSNRKEQLKRRIVPILISSVIIFTSIISPPARAIIEGWLQVSSVEEGKSHIGFSWDSTAGQGQKNYQSLKDVENEFNLNVPFPKIFSDLEINEAHKQYQYSANVDNNKLITVHYRLNTNERSYNLMVTRAMERPEFSAGTARNSVIDKEIEINGNKGRLIAIQDMNILNIYLEKGPWKLVLTASSGGIDTKSDPPVTEEEIINLAESITW
jgi:hypothetical protein